MKNNKFLVFISAFAVSLLVMAAQPSVSPMAQDGKILLDAGVVTAIPGLDASIPGRYTIGIQNDDTFPICCSWSSSLSASCQTGWLVAPANNIGQAGGSLAMDIGTSKVVYCVSPTGQTNADGGTRWQEIK